jgi:putative cardiolipin synthase
VIKELGGGLDEAEHQLLRQIDALPVHDYLSKVESQVITCEVEVLADAPRKMEGRAGFVSPVRKRLFELSTAAQKEILIENGYFIPRDEGVIRLREQVQRGVQVKVLTNSLASNDTGVSHAGYQRYRQALLGADIALYELRADAALSERFELGRGGACATGLHSKAATLDRKLAFVGSYNLDPRSAFINTEIGVIVHHAGFAEALAQVILEGMAPQNSWMLSLSTADIIEWHGENEVSREPKASWRKRLVARCLSLLPIERQL